jgi:hypothetical protein
MGGMAIACRRALLSSAAIVLSASVAAAETEAEEWRPQPPMPERFDWIELVSGEWLKGELVAMYDDELEFDSDELNVLTLDWKDVRQVRTARVVQVGFRGRITAVGQLLVEGKTVRVLGEEELRFDRSELYTIVPGARREVDYWSGKATLGFNARRGNTDVIEATLQSRLTRRTVKNRMTFDYIFTFNETEGEQTANSHRVNLGWDRFVSDRLYVKPVFYEWLRDPFQNINQRNTVGTGLGYQILDSARAEWQVAGGPAYQRTTFDSVEAGTENPDGTPAFVIATTFDAELTRWMDFDYEYRAQFTEKEAGQYNHHMVAGFETEITTALDFDVSGVWDRVQSPRENDAGEIPEQDDFRLIVGISLDF